MTTQEVRLCGLLLREHFGEVVEKVGTHLLKSGTQNLRTILHESGMSLDLVRLLHSCLFCFGEGIRQYKLEFKECKSEINLMVLWFHFTLSACLSFIICFSFFKCRLRSPCVCLYSMGCVFSAQAAEDLAAPQSTGPAATGFWESCVSHVTSTPPRPCTETQESWLWRSYCRGVNWQWVALWRQSPTASRRTWRVSCSASSRHRAPPDETQRLDDCVSLFQMAAAWTTARCRPLSPNWWRPILCSAALQWQSWVKQTAPLVTPPLQPPAVSLQRASPTATRCRRWRSEGRASGDSPARTQRRKGAQRNPDWILRWASEVRQTVLKYQSWKNQLPLTLPLIILVSSAQTHGDEGIYWQVNFERFHLYFRDQAIISAVANKLDQVRSNSLYKRDKSCTQGVQPV